MHYSPLGHFTGLHFVNKILFKNDTIRTYAKESNVEAIHELPLR
jgi:hypothetical protein